MHAIISKVIRSAFFLLGIFFLPVVVYPQFSSSVRYDIDKGFVSNTAYFLLKDRDGYLWITTDKGVVKYDGYNFNVFTTDDGLADNENFEVYQDSQGRIWFSAYNGIPSYYYKGKFYNLRKLFESKNIYQDGPSYKVMEVNGSLWLLNRKTLYKYSPGKLTRFSAGSASFVSMSYDFKRQRMIVLVVGRYKGLTIDMDNKVDSMDIADICPISITKTVIKNDKLFYSSYKGVSIVDLATHKSKQVKISEEVLCVNDAGDDRNLFLGATSRLYGYDTFNDSLFVKFEDEKNVSSIFPGLGYSYWCTSLNEGLSFIGNENVQLLNNRNALPFEYVSLVRKMNDKLIISSDKYRFCIYDLKKRTILYEYSGENKGAGRGFASAIRTTNGDIYISFKRNLFKIEPDGKVSEVPLNNVSYDILYTGKYYFGLHTDKISRAIKFSSITQVPDDFESMDVNARHLFYDPYSNNIYAYGNNGIFVTHADSFNRISNFYAVPELTTNISTIAQVSDSMLVIGTSVNGLHFMKNNRLVGNISKQQGLSSNNVSSVTVYNNEIWVGTDEGINVIKAGQRPGDFSISYLGKKDGIFSTEVNDIYIENDTAYVASPFGLFYFNKNHIHTDNELPVMNINYVKFSYKTVDPDQKIYVLAQDNNLKVKYTGISFRAMGSLWYRYKLDPVDVEWHYTTAREFEFPALKPGSYKLYIQCRGDRSVWSKTKTIEFVIQPALYQRNDVKVFVGLLIVIIIIFLIDWRIRTINKQHELKEKLLELEKHKLEAVRDQAIKDKEIIELEQQALRLHMNPHFVFNAINAIQGFYAGNEVGKAKQFISYFSRLLRLILETSREKLIPLSTEVDIIKNYLELFLLRFEDKYKYTITFADWEDEQFILIPPMIIQPFVENAVLHGISPLKSKGEIFISFKSTDNYLEAIIQDNGIGRKRSEELKIASKGKSTGINVAKMRLKNLNTDPAYDNNVEIIDLEENNTPSGTKVILRIPIHT